MESRPVPVTVGNFNDQFIEIRSGLKEGDQVALTPPAGTSEDIDLGGSQRTPGIPPASVPAKISSAVRGETQTRQDPGGTLPENARSNPKTAAQKSSTEPSRL